MQIGAGLLCCVHQVSFQDHAAETAPRVTEDMVPKPIPGQGFPPLNPR